MKNDQTQLVLDILSSKWATRIVKVLDDDTKRFSEIQKALPDTKQKVLTETLRQQALCKCYRKLANINYS